MPVADHVVGPWQDGGGNSFCALCVSDMNADDLITLADLIDLLSRWGDCPSSMGSGCLGDFDDDGVVGLPDLLTLLAGWGGCSQE